jgi:8-oxo-dGTP pyrophosphatase MutT (NUDIX family)
MIKQILAGSDDAQHQDTLERTGYWGKRAAGVLAMCVTTKRFLLSHRSAHVEQPFTWGTIGGAIDEKENIVQALTREFREETKYAGKLRLIPAYVFKDKGFEYHNFIGLCAAEFEAKPDYETHAFEWFHLHELPKPLHFGLVSLLKDSGTRATLKKIMS